MADTQRKNLLLLTLVHPDFLPPVYASAQTLRDEGYNIHILTFDSFVPAELDLGDNITIESAGRHHGIGLLQRLQMRRKFTARARELAARQEAIISFCAFSYLCALRINRGKPVIYHALEVADFIPALFMSSPLSHLNNLLALRRAHKADVIATPSVQRSAWLAGRSHLDHLPYTVLNTAYLPPQQEPDSYATYKAIVPAELLNKTTVLYTGAVNSHLCIMELVQAFELVDDDSAALLITGIKDNPYCNEIKAHVAKSRAAARIKLFPYVSRAEMLALQANAAIGVCLAREYEDNVESKMMAPNKTGEYLAKGLYLLGIENEYMMPFKMKGIAALAASPAPQDVSVALKQALHAVADKRYQAAIRSFVQEYFCMQQQLKPVIRYLKDKTKR